MKEFLKHLVHEISSKDNFYYPMNSREILFDDFIIENHIIKDEDEYFCTVSNYFPSFFKKGSIHDQDNYFKTPIYQISENVEAILNKINIKNKKDDFFIAVEEFIKNNNGKSYGFIFFKDSFFYFSFNDSKSMINIIEFGKQENELYTNPEIKIRCSIDLNDKYNCYNAYLDTFLELGLDTSISRKTGIFIPKVMTPYADNEYYPDIVKANEKLAQVNREYYKKHGYQEEYDNEGGEFPVEDLKQQSIINEVQEKFEIIAKFLMFLKYAPVENKELFIVNENNSNKKFKLPKSKAITKTKINYIDCNYFTNLFVKGDFKVSGHFRLQPVGAKREKKKLIWIKDFNKTGYTRKAKILKDRESK